MPNFKCDSPRKKGPHVKKIDFQVFTTINGFFICSFIIKYIISIFEKFESLFNCKVRVSLRVSCEVPVLDRHFNRSSCKMKLPRVMFLSSRTVAHIEHKYYKRYRSVFFKFSSFMEDNIYPSRVSDCKCLCTRFKAYTIQKRHLLLSIICTSKLIRGIIDCPEPFSTKK